MSDEIAARLRSLRREFDETHDAARFTSITEEIGSIGGEVSTLPSEIEEIRNRGYAFRSYLENKAEKLHEHWRDIRQSVRDSVERESDDLKRELSSVERWVERAENDADDPDRAGSTIDKAQEELGELKSKIEGAERRISSTFSTLRQDISQTKTQLSQINWYLDQKDEASFDFLAGEALFLAAKAEWVKTGKNKQDPDGILYLTDQRLLFEQKETTGKRLGMFGGKKEQELELDLPLGQIEGVEPEKKGMLGGIDLLNFELGSGAPFSTLTIEVKGGVNCKFWAKQIERMISGDTQDERAIEPDPELVEKLRNAPTECHVCGGTLPMIVAGMTQVECEYCGSVVRI